MRQPRWKESKNEKSKGNYFRIKRWSKRDTKCYSGYNNEDIEKIAYKNMERIVKEIL